MNTAYSLEGERTSRRERERRRRGRCDAKELFFGGTAWVVGAQGKQATDELDVCGQRHVSRGPNRASSNIPKSPVLQLRLPAEKPTCPLQRTTHSLFLQNRPP